MLTLSISSYLLSLDGWESVIQMNICYTEYKMIIPFGSQPMVIIKLSKHSILTEFITSITLTSMNHHMHFFIHTQPSSPSSKLYLEQPMLLYHLLFSTRYSSPLPHFSYDQSSNIFNPTISTIITSPKLHSLSFYSTPHQSSFIQSTQNHFFAFSPSKPSIFTSIPPLSSCQLLYY
jgi:hypothetical protein